MIMKRSRCTPSDDALTAAGSRSISVSRGFRSLLRQWMPGASGGEGGRLGDEDYHGEANFRVPPDEHGDYLEDVERRMLRKLYEACWLDLT